MPLEEYVAKRSFSNTPEPAPSKSAPKFAGNYFCVQRHDATRLHYDFRLEIDGVLKSWAVPKGPSLDPAVKHLAAHVEDHPIEYGDFEGNIPAGNYGAGSVMLWDRGTFDLLGDTSGAAQIERGDLKFRLHGEKLNGEFALVLMKGRGKGNEWLIIKKRDEFAAPGWDIESLAYSVLSGRAQEEIARNLPAKKSKRKSAGAADRVWESSRPASRKSAPAKPVAKAAPKKKTKIDPSVVKGARKAEMPSAVEPMMAQIADRVPKGADWLFEVKWDGVRAIAFIENETVRLQSRTGNRCERQYPELSAMPHQIAAQSAILDGEISILDSKGVSQFHLIQPRIMNADPNSVAHMSRNTPVVYFVFDLLYLDGYDLRGVRLDERRNLLEEIVTSDPYIRISAAFPGAGEEMLEAARDNGLEGLLAKRASSCYEPKRSSEWLKIKIVSQQEFVIGGFTEPQGDRSYFGALVLGLYEDGKLNWVGNVGTGFDQKTLAFLYSRLKPLVTTKCPFAGRPAPDRGMTWVKPELIAQVKFTQWTPDKRLRAPVYLGLREDVKPEHASLESPAAPREFLADIKEATCDVDGQLLKFTNLKKVYYPDEGYTKRDVINYYDAVSGLILPHLKDRPLSLKRYPNGIKEEFFFQKHAAETFAPWLRTELIDSDHNEAPINYVFAQDRASLLYLANLGCIDQNPWMSRSGSLDNPDFVLIDLDPQACPFDKIVEAALLVKGVLDEIDMEGYPKTTGGDGMHVYIPVEPEYTYEQTRTFAEVIARIVTRRKPELFTTPRSVAKRERNRVYFDWAQNAKSKTIAAPYVLRAYGGAPVATPLDWSEVRAGLHPAQFNISNVRERFREKGDLFEGVLKQPQRIEKALGKLEKLFR